MASCISALRREGWLSIGRSDWLHSTTGRLDYSARNAATKAANIERVFNAIDDGHETVVKIMEAAGLSKSTVLKAINDLQDWPTGARIRRVTGQSHRFFVI